MNIIFLGTEGLICDFLLVKFGKLFLVYPYMLTTLHSHNYTDQPTNFIKASRCKQTYFPAKYLQRNTQIILWEMSLVNQTQYRVLDHRYRVATVRTFELLGCLAWLTFCPSVLSSRPGRNIVWRTLA